MADTLYRLEVESLDLGADVRSVGLELIDPENREPVTGATAAGIWAAVVLLLAGDDPWVLDFFAHLERVRDFCHQRAIAFREPNSHTLFIPQPAPAETLALFERFAGETFGVRTGALVAAGDPVLEGALAQQGVDAYHIAFANYQFCAVCDFENGFLTLLSGSLWASEVIRRLRAPLALLQTAVERPGPA